MADDLFDKKLNRAASVTDIIANIIHIVTWLFSLIAGYALVSQDEPIRLPGTNFYLDADYQFALLVCALIVYLHFLQLRWKRDKESKGYSSKFYIFVLRDIPSGKNWLYLIPFVFYFVLWARIADLALNQGMTFIPVAIVLLVIVIIATYLNVALHGWNDSSEPAKDLRTEWNLDNELKGKWVRRIRNKLQEKDKVSTEDFMDIGMSSKYESQLQTNWAFEMYFNQFEFEEDLTLTPTELVKLYDGRVLFRRTLYKKIRSV